MKAPNSRTEAPRSRWPISTRDASRPDRHHREQESWLGEPERADPSTLADGEMALCQIAGEEQDDYQLGDLAGLETNLREAQVDQDPQPAPVGFEAFDRERAARRQHRQEEQQQGPGQEQVPIPTKSGRALAVQEPKQSDREPGRDDQPPLLKSGPTRIQTVDLGQPDRGEECGGREQSGRS